MTCSDAIMIINAVSIHNDKLIVLDCVKRYGGDSSISMRFAFKSITAYLFIFIN